ncbi:hypothetical protein BGZ95_004585 [Linnemannia exigua]|uniref:FAD-binding domain-containing protein n=1 Tax=Linnemannia exigua TaxID=604196 RepID=A0AAD4D4Y3_9FUNG|nr:hypothetical protein BGZ95_004585 [Linnemannia exigua]
MSKKIVSFEQDQDGVTVTFEDNTTVRGDILVGADGTHSAVRQHLYGVLDKEGILPKSDTKEMNRGYISIVGTTEELDPTKYPGMLKEDSESYMMIGDGDTPYTWVTFTVPGNRICWNVVIQLGVSDIADEQFKSSDWVPQQNQTMMDMIRHFRTPYGTLGELFDVTPTERVSKVAFEDMLFETWTHGRTVLIGDAAHKLLPSSGAGAVNAMQDAVILANRIYDIKSTSFENIKTALSDYKEERFNDVKDQYPQSYMAAKLMYGHVDVFHNMSTTYDTTNPVALSGDNHLLQATDSPPHVIISGAGLAGLFLGVFLERAGIPYDIYERASEIKPLGAIMCLSPNVLPAFEQLGLLEELMSFSKPSRGGDMLTDKLKLIGTATASSVDIIGYDRILFARPELYDMLISKTPSHKLHLAKKIVTFEQDQNGVTVAFGDDTIARGDILVGADGAHSAVRKHLFATLDKLGLLPKQDNKDMNKGYISLVGTTEPLDPVRYPDLLKEECVSTGIIGDGDTPYTICWNVVIQLGVDPVADELAGTSDWVVQDNNEKLMDSIRHFKTPYGVLGDLFDATPTELVSKVYFEDKLFETWNHGRTVLIGDAAHKMLPSTGVGAVNAMQDAVILANHLYDILPNTFENIKTALYEYKEERFNAVKDQYPLSYMSAKLMFGHTWMERMLRHVVFNWLPKSIQQAQIQKDTAYRPQANFLPQAPKRGTMETIPQQPSKRIQAEEAMKQVANAL